MANKTHIPFFVMNEDQEKKKFYKFDIMTHLVRQYKAMRAIDRPRKFGECKAFIERISMKEFWLRREYEVVLSPLTGSTPTKKIDIHYQILMNLDVITSLFMQNVGLRV